MKQLLVLKRQLPNVLLGNATAKNDSQKETRPMEDWKRVLEPEVMDSPEEARDYDQMDHSQVNAGFVADLLSGGSLSDPVSESPVLDLGTGTARIPILLCQADAALRIVAVDLAAEMLAVAAENVQAAGLAQRIQLERVDAKSLPYAEGMFSTVISNSIVHHIPAPAEVLAEAERVTAPGGRLFFRDLLRPADRQQWQQLVERHAGHEAPHARQMFADSLRAALTLREVQQLVGDLGFASQTVQQTSDRHWTWSARKPGP